MTRAARSSVSPSSTRDALSRYDCHITHVRRSPLRHRFAYRSPLWLVDVDRVPALPRVLRVVNRFDVADHWTPGTSSLRDGLDTFLTARGVAVPPRALLLTGARSFGHCFNPLSVWWCLDVDGRPTHVVAEVHNTYRGRHAYLLEPDATGRDSVDKSFYVSPFFAAAEGRYRMQVPMPDDELRLAVSLELRGSVPFTAAVHGLRRPSGRWGLLRRPFAQLRVAALIRVEGIRLWRRGLPVQPRTGAPDVARRTAGNLGASHGA